MVSILILLDYLFLYFYIGDVLDRIGECFNPYFTGLPILIKGGIGKLEIEGESFNPYFTGLPILIFRLLFFYYNRRKLFQSLFYWITYSYWEFKL